MPPIKNVIFSVWNALFWLPYLVDPCLTLTFEILFSLQSLSEVFSDFIPPQLYELASLFMQTPPASWLLLSVNSASKSTTAYSSLCLQHLVC